MVNWLAARVLAIDAHKKRVMAATAGLREYIDPRESGPARHDTFWQLQLD